MDTLARKLEGSSRVKENIAFNSYKSNSLQYCESRVEVYTSLLNEFKNKIGVYVNQPTSVFYERKKKIVRYTPDSLIQLVNGDVYFEEVKPICDANDPVFIEKFKFLRNHFENNLNVGLVLNTAKTEIRGFKYCNYEILYPHLKQAMRNNSLHIYKEISESLPRKLSFSKLIAECQYLTQSRSVAFEMIAIGMYSFSKTEELNGSTVLELLHG
jgi:hypothetical protein